MTRTLALAAALALISTTALAQAPETPPAPVCKSATESPACGEVARLSIVVAVLQAQRNQALAQAADLAAMAEVQKATAPKAAP